MTPQTPRRARRRDAEAVLRDARGTTICEQCRIADTVLARMRGLLGRKALDPGEGLLLRPAPSIQTFFMRFPVDAVFLDRRGRVLKVVEHLRPWRIAGCRGANAVLELAAGEAKQRGVRPGDRLEAQPMASGRADVLPNRA